jgi:homoserine kinase
MAHAFRIKVPASTSNLGPGFDTLGLALELFNEVEVFVSGKKLELKIEGEGEKELPRSSRNLFIQAMDLVLKASGKSRPAGLKIRMTNHIPLARGLGSSAATIIAGILAGHKLSKKDHSEKELLQFALKLEEHPDNLVPALVGGLSLSILEGEEAFYLGLPIPLGLQVVMIIPNFKLSTKKARKALPKNVPFGDAVFNLGRSSLLTASLIAGRYDLLKLATKDKLHQNYRFHLSSDMKKIFEIATESGGCGTVMSGAGPSILTFVNHHETPVELVRILQDNLQRKKLPAQIKILGIARQGAIVEDIPS